VRATGFVPHRHLLDRVSVGACHAGKGTVTRAARAGVPMLLFPHGRDQFQVARGAVNAGVAVAFDPGGWRHTDVRAAVLDVIGGDRHRRAAQDLAKAAARYDAAAAGAGLVAGLASLPVSR
jgi:UDP:flavonoid glycosyltransferase YjiC (YdhE family)